MKLKLVIHLIFYFAISSPAFAESPFSLEYNWTSCTELKNERSEVGGLLLPNVDAYCMKPKDELVYMVTHYILALRRSGHISLNFDEARQVIEAADNYHMNIEMHDSYNFLYMVDQCLRKNPTVYSPNCFQPDGLSYIDGILLPNVDSLD